MTGLVTTTENNVFEELLRELRRLEGTNQIAVSVQFDEDGYLDRQCPVDACTFLFKVYGEDWQQKVGDQAFCPSCGYADDLTQWNTQEQIDHSMEVIISEVNQRLGDAMRRDAEHWNRRQRRGSLVTVTMKVEGRPMPVLLPPAAAERMQLKIECSQCECRYAVVGVAFFCPICGNNDAKMMFSQAMSGIRTTLDAIGEIRAGLSDRDTTANIIRSLVENGLEDAVTVFQRYSEALYLHLVSDSNLRKNAFQNLDRGSDLWFKATGKQYSDYITPDEMLSLKHAFQQRHLLAHTHGIVDQAYIAQGGDSSLREGQRLVITEPAVRQCLELIEKLAEGMSGTVNSSRTPNS